MNQYICHNGKFLRNDQPIISANNRGLRYGDGLFETMKMLHGTIALHPFHMERLFQGLQLFQFECPVFFTPEYLLGQVQELCRKNGHTESARIRITIYRGAGGIYDPANHFPNCIMESWPLPPANGLNENGLVAGIYSACRKTADAFSACKHNNYLPYMMAAMYAKSQQWNDALVLNSNGRVCDASIANVFIVKKKQLITPSLAEGCVGGTMRRWIIREMTDTNPVIETQVSINDIMEAEEVFLSNAVYGLRWVGTIGEKRYTNTTASLLYQKIQQALW